MSTNDELYGEGDRQLLAMLAALVQDEESTPQAVLEAASAILPFLYFRRRGWL